MTKTKTGITFSRSEVIPFSIIGRNHASRVTVRHNGLKIGTITKRAFAMVWVAKVRFPDGHEMHRPYCDTLKYAKAIIREYASKFDG